MIYVNSSRVQLHQMNPRHPFYFEFGSIITTVFSLSYMYRYDIRWRAGLAGCSCTIGTGQAHTNLCLSSYRFLIWHCYPVMWRPLFLRSNFEVIFSMTSFKGDPEVGMCRRLLMYSRDPISRYCMRCIVSRNCKIKFSLASNSTWKEGPWGYETAMKYELCITSLFNVRSWKFIFAFLTKISCEVSNLTSVYIGSPEISACTLQRLCRALTSPILYRHVENGFSNFSEGRACECFWNFSSIRKYSLLLNVRF